MKRASHKTSITTKAIHARRKIVQDSAAEIRMAARLRKVYEPAQLMALYDQARMVSGCDGYQTRRILLRAMARKMGHGVRIAPGVVFIHPETLVVGDGVFFGANSVIQGRDGGRCAIGNFTWIGPLSFLDARNLRMGEYVGWGPGAKVLGSEHTGRPAGKPIITTDLETRPVSIGAWSDIGTNATILPGVAVGKGAIVGAGAVVTGSVRPFSISAGVPARFMKWRPGYRKKQ